MAKHRKRSRVRSSVARRTTGLAAAAVGATSVTTAIVTGTTPAIAPSVDLMALVSAANSTSQFFAGSSYYGTDWTTVYGEQQVVPFLLGPQGLADAISSHQGDHEETGVTASGWGAGQTGTALGILANNNDDDDLDNVGLVILDNNTNRAGGGFWTTYYLFAPLLLTSAEPTPTNLPDGLTVLDVGYEYNINGNAAVDPLNPFALGNSLAAYIYGYGAESTALDITQKQNGDVVLHQADGPDVTLQPGTHYIVEDGNIVDKLPAGTQDSTIYVTVDSGDLPLTRPLRLFPGGDILADALDPTLTALVDAGYADGKGTTDNPAIPEDPTVTRPMQPGSSLTALGGVPSTLQDGATAGVSTAIEDFANPGNFITKPIGEVGELPFLSSLPSTLTNSTVNTTNNKSALTGLKKPAGITSSTGGERPRLLKKAADDFNTSLKKFAGGLRGQTSEDSDDNVGLDSGGFSPRRLLSRSWLPH